MKRIGCSDAPLVPDDLSPLRIDGGTTLEDVTEADVTGAAPGLHAAGASLTESRLTSVNLAESELPRLRAGNVEFDRCNLSSVELLEASLWRARFSESKLSGLQLTRGTLLDVEFANCRLDLVSFSEMKVKRVTFRSCAMQDADFSGTFLDHVRFEDCDLSGALFGRMQIERCEMRRCTLTGLRGVAALRGVMMERDDIAANAQLFASELGIEAAPAAKGDEG